MPLTEASTAFAYPAGGRRRLIATKAALTSSGVASSTGRRETLRAIATCWLTSSCTPNSFPASHRASWSSADQSGDIGDTTCAQRLFEDALETKCLPPREDVRPTLRGALNKAEIFELYKRI